MQCYFYVCLCISAVVYLNFFQKQFKLSAFGFNWLRWVFFFGIQVQSVLNKYSSIIRCFIYQYRDHSVIDIAQRDLYQLSSRSLFLGFLIVTLTAISYGHSCLRCGTLLIYFLDI